MAINFPNSPEASVTTYTSGTTTWQWNGTAWNVVLTDTGFATEDYVDTAISNIPAGPTGATGPQGPTGATGTSVQLKGAVAEVADLDSIISPTPGDLYVVTATGDGYVWDGSEWDNAGAIRGPQGESGGVVGELSGNLTFTGTGNRILGDFSNATLADRVAFQTTLTNGSTTIMAIPNGSGPNSQLLLRSSSTAADDSFGQVVLVGGSEFRIASGASGTGTALPMTFHTNGSSRVTISTDGNVGIGIAPQSLSRLYVSDSEAWQVLNSTTTGYSSMFQLITPQGSMYVGKDRDGSAGYWSNSGEYTIAGTGSYPMDFYTNSARRMRISAAGGLSVGTTADPGAGAIHATGNITAFYSSDARLKENIQDVEGALDIVCSIGSKTFDWTDDYIASKGGVDGYFVQKTDFGVVAQDVQAVFPQAVRTRTDGTLAVDYEKLATLAFGAIQELVKRIEALEAR